MAEGNKNIQFKRVLTLKYLIAFGLAYLAPTVVFNYYGIITKLSGGMMTLVYIITTVVLIFTAYSYTRMVKAYPIAGSAYTYVRRAVNPTVGFMTGWVMLLDYLLLPMICYLLIGVYMNETFPQVPVWVWVVIVMLIGAVINIVGVKTAAVVDSVIVTAQILFTIAFVVLCVVFVSNGHSSGSLLMSSAIFNPTTFDPANMMWAASILACSFLGFDAVSTLAEETKDPGQTISKAILIIVIGAGAMFAVVSYFSQIAWPEAYKDIVNEDAGIFELLPMLGGDVFQTIFLITDNLASFVCAMAGLAAVSRILFGMGRDGMLPKKIFGTLSKRFQTPVNNIIITSLIALTAVFYSDNLLGAASLVSFGALIGFTLVNYSVIGHYFIRGKKRSGGDAVRYLILPLIGMVLCIALWFSIDTSAKTLGGIWVVIGIIVLAAMTKGFKVQPRDMDLSEEQDEVAAG
ncbi:MAG: APC family permease [Clostridiales Family XIII bacterium]|jgi:amino acid transporter|nr:APC family permease [Clostridiales Family XIII bacterium]